MRKLLILSQIVTSMQFGRKRVYSWLFWIFFPLISIYRDSKTHGVFYEMGGIHTTYSQQATSLSLEYRIDIEQVLAITRKHMGRLMGVGAGAT